MLSSSQQGWLLKQYRIDPCRTFPNAFWKTMGHPERLRLEHCEDASHALQKLAVWQDDRLLAFWCANPDDLVPTDCQRGASLALVHADALSAFSGLTFQHKEAFFRLIHKGRPQDYNCPSGFALKDVNQALEIQSVSELIRVCYPEMQVNEEVVSTWTRNPVHDPRLWVWIMDTEKGIPAGLGIAELDPVIPEASLEWIQVLPEYRGRGLGKAVIIELLRRVSARVDFVTVSGKVDNETNPEWVYRQCGFSGSDVWWFLTR